MQYPIQNMPERERRPRIGKIHERLTLKVYGGKDYPGEAKEKDETI
jgi:hypothetical protein